MGELAELTAAGRGDVIPGYVLSPLGLLELGEAKEEFGRWHIATVAASVRGLAKDQQESLILAAAERVSCGFLAYGTRTFRLRTLSPAGLRLILFLSLRIRQPDVTWQKAGDLLAANSGPIQDALFELLGYRQKKVASPPTTVEGGTNPSSGKSSSIVSPSSASIPGKPPG